MKYCYKYCYLIVIGSAAILFFFTLGLAWITLAHLQESVNRGTPVSNIEHMDVEPQSRPSTTKHMSTDSLAD